MTWLLIALVVGLLAVILWLWRQWGAPWAEIEAVLRRIVRGERPRSWIVSGGAASRRVGFAMEKLFEEHRQIVQEMAERSKGAEIIFGALQDGLLVVDRQRHVSLVNRTFAQIFGVDGNVTGQPLLEVIREPEVDQVIREVLRTGEPQRTDISIVDARHNASHTIQLSAVGVAADGGEAAGAVVLFHDITQLKQADEIRRDFVANVSHELRTPLSILRGYIETLLDDPETPSEERMRMLEVMQRHSLRLGSLVDDLLTLAQLESANPNLQLSEVRLSELFAGIVRDWGKKFSEKKLKIEIGVSPDLPLFWADETRLQEVLYNLLDNALKYSPTGGKILIQGRKKNDEIILSVSDSGIGISETDLPRIFERFYRTDKARSRELGGTGLGLAIVKHIAQMHGGRVEAESQLEKGTTIRVILPAKISKPEEN